MKHFRNKQKCECKPYFLERSKIFSLFSLYIFTLFGSFWSHWLSLVKVSLYKLTQQGDGCVFKDFYAISFYDAQYMSWTDNGRSFHHSTGGFQVVKRRVMGSSIGIFTED
jgi:hypothetical protein